MSSSNSNSLSQQFLTNNNEFSLQSSNLKKLKTAITKNESTAIQFFTENISLLTAICKVFDVNNTGSTVKNQIDVTDIILTTLQVIPSKSFSTTNQNVINTIIQVQLHVALSRFLDLDGQHNIIDTDLLIHCVQILSIIYGNTTPDILNQIQDLNYLGKTVQLITHIIENINDNDGDQDRPLRFLASFLLICVEKENPQLSNQVIFDRAAPVYYHLWRMVAFEQYGGIDSNQGYNALQGILSIIRKAPTFQTMKDLDDSLMEHYGWEDYYSLPTFCTGALLSGGEYHLRSEQKESVCAILSWFFHKASQDEINELFPYEEIKDMIMNSWYKERSDDYTSFSNCLHTQVLIGHLVKIQTDEERNQPHLPLVHDDDDEEDDGGNDNHNAQQLMIDDLLDIWPGDTSDSMLKLIMKWFLQTQKEDIDLDYPFGLQLFTQVLSACLIEGDEEQKNYLAKFKVMTIFNKILQAGDVSLDNSALMNVLHGLRVLFSMPNKDNSNDDDDEVNKETTKFMEDGGMTSITNLIQAIESNVGQHQQQQQQLIPMLALAKEVLGLLQIKSNGGFGNKTAKVIA
jgi:hypothetical protein